MVFDLEMIKKVYEKYPERIEAARKVIGRPLTLSEKYCMLIFGIKMQLFLMKEGNRMLISRLTE